MHAYQTKARKIPGTDFREIRQRAMDLYQNIRKKSKRSPYVRSAYFKKEKIFLALFWPHLFDKGNWSDRMRRLKYFYSAIELLEKNRFAPESKVNPNKRSEIFHRFKGISSDGEVFYVQVKENIHTGQKHFISVFPED